MHADEARRDDPVLQRAIALVDDFFDGMLAPIEAWVPALSQELKTRLDDEGPLTGLQLAALVEADVHRILETPERPLYGAGYCASDVVVNEGNPLAWWQGPDRSLLGASMFGPGQASIDLSRLEWYRVPESTGKSHVAGPFVDYLCSNEITITAAIPVYIDEKFSGVVCADVLVASLEQVLLPQLEELNDVTLVNAGGRVVVSTDLSYETGDRFVCVDGERGIETLAATHRVMTSERYPFALVVPVRPTETPRA